MSKYKNGAFVVMAQCGQTKQCIGITLNPITSKHYRAMWAFKIKKDIAKREHFDKTSVDGNIDLDIDFCGCPYCGATSFYFCGKCGKMVCYDGKTEIVTCPNCGTTSELQISDNFHIEGGSY